MSQPKIVLSKTSTGYHCAIFSYDDHKGAMSSEAYLKISSPNHLVVACVLKTLGYLYETPSKEEFVEVK